MNSTGLEASGMIIGFYSYTQNILSIFFSYIPLRKQKVPFFVILGLVCLSYNETREFSAVYGLQTLNWIYEGGVK